MKIDPFSGLSNPMIDFSSTDFPVPDGPSNTDTSPAGRVNVTSDQMFELPNDFERFLIPTSTPPMRCLLLRRSARPTSPPGRGFPVTWRSDHAVQPPSQAA